MKKCSVLFQRRKTQGLPRLQLTPSLVMSPALDRAALAEMIIQDGYPEAVAKSPRSRSDWFTSYVEGRLL